MLCLLPLFRVTLNLHSCHEYEAKNRKKDSKKAAKVSWQAVLRAKRWSAAMVDALENLMPCLACLAGAVVYCVNVFLACIKVKAWYLIHTSEYNIRLFSVLGYIACEKRFVFDVQAAGSST